MCYGSSSSDALLLRVGSGVARVGSLLCVSVPARVFTGGLCTSSTAIQLSTAFLPVSLTWSVALGRAASSVDNGRSAGMVSR